MKSKNLKPAEGSSKKLTSSPSTAKSSGSTSKSQAKAPNSKAPSTKPTGAASKKDSSSKTVVAKGKSVSSKEVVAKEVAGKPVAKASTGKATVVKSTSAKPAAKQPAAKPSAGSKSNSDSKKPTSSAKAASPSKTASAQKEKTTPVTPSSKASTKPSKKTASKPLEIVKPKSAPVVPKSQAKLTSFARSTPAEKSVPVAAPEKAVVAPAKVAPEKATKVKAYKPVPVKGPVSPPPKPTNPKVVRKIRELQTTKELRKDLSQDIVVLDSGLNTAQDINHDPQRDRIVLVVRDSYWLHASWEVTRRSVERAKAAMAEHWHTIRPILRVLKIDNSGTTNNAETIQRDIEIHGGVRNWYIDVTDPPSSFRVLLGYIAANGRFHELARSNVVTTPVPGSDEAVSTHWADIARDAERIFALSGGYTGERETKDLQEMFEDHLKRPMGAPALAQFGSGAEGGIRRHRNFHFDLDAEMVVFGSTHPDAYVTLGGEPVKVRSDGTFSVRVPLPDRRQVLPATACTRDGVDEQTIVIAVERNTKVMEPLSKENAEEA